MPTTHTSELNLSPIPLTRWAIGVGGLRGFDARGVDFREAVQGLVAVGWLHYDADKNAYVASREGRHQVAVDDVLHALEAAVRMSGGEWDDILSDVEAIRIMEDEA